MDPERRARLLVLYADMEAAAALARQLAGVERELILCPASVPVGGWLREMRPDLILLHAAHGGSDLLSTCALLRKHTDFPIVVLAPAGDEFFVAKVLGLGVDECFALPASNHELQARLTTLLRRVQRYQVSEDLITVGDLTLSFRDRTVERSGRKIGLSPIEFRLLACLVLAPGTVLTHQTLMARVWGVEYVDSRHYLRLYIRYLREKLEDDPTKPLLILSEWGVGYRLQPQGIVVAMSASRASD